MSGWTKGPWRYDGGATGSVKQDSTAGLVAIAYSGNVDCEPDEEMRANARLISAAPDLLEALKECVRAFLADAKHGPQKTIIGDDVVYHLDGQTLGHALEVARAAIKKAEGER